MIYRPGIYNLQTRTLTFPEQEKLLEKLNLRYLKTLKTKKLKTKNPQIKHWPCLNNVMICRPDLYNLQTREKTTKNVTKNWNWPFLGSQLLNISNINTGHKSKMVWNKKNNLRSRIVQFGDQKKVWTDTNSTNQTFDK